MGALWCRISAVISLRSVASHVSEHFDDESKMHFKDNRNVSKMLKLIT